MPLEVRELIIKTTVESTPRESNWSPMEIRKLKNEIIEECLAKVMRTLKRKPTR